jgi:WD40 repeat protein
LATDAERLDGFVRRSDEDPFTALAQRHGSMAPVFCIVIGLLLAAGLADDGAGALALHEPVAAQGAAGADQRPPRADRQGDPLPAGALVRLGTLRWRAGSEVESLAYTPDGKTLMAASTYGVCLFDTATGKLTRRLPCVCHYGGIALSPDGKRLLTYGYSTSRHGNIIHIKRPVEIWELPDGRKTLEDDRENVQWIGWSAEGRALALYLGKGHVLLRELESGREQRFTARDLPPIVQGLTSCAYAAGGRLLAVPNRGGVIHVWDVVTGVERRALKAKDTCIVHMALSADGLSLAVATESPAIRHTVQLWDVAAGKATDVVDAEPKYFRAVALSPDGKVLAAIGGGEVRFWDVATGRGRGLIGGGGWAFARAAAFSPDGRTLATAQDHCSTVHLWDTATGALKSEPAGHAGWPGEVAFSPDGRWVATTGGLDGTIYVWDPQTGAPLVRVCRRGWVRACAFSADGRLLFSCWTGDKLVFSDAATGRELHTVGLGAPGLSGLHMCLSDDRRTVVALSDPLRRHAELRVAGWDTATRKQLFGRWCSCGEHFGIAVSADTKVLAMPQGGGPPPWSHAPGSGPIRLEELATGEQLLSLPAPEGQTRPLAFSPDGRLLVTCTFGPRQRIATGGRPGENVETLRVWELASATEVLAWPTVSNCRVAFSPDSRVLALSAPARQILLWDLRRGRELRRIGGFDADVTSLAFSPDGRRLVSGLSDSTLLVWDVTATRPAPGAGGIDAAGAARAWADLAADALRAFAARGALVDSPEMAVPLLREHLKPAPSVDARRLQTLLAELDSDQFGVREEARKGLQAMGELAAPALRQALDQKPSPEARRRIRGLLEKLHGPVTQTETLRALRAMAVLEDIATPQARDVLEDLARGTPEARLTQAAKESLTRLQRR